MRSASSQCGVDLSVCRPAGLTFHIHLTMTSATTTTETSTPPSALNTEKSGDGQVKRLHQIPRPETKEAERGWLLAQMAAAFRIFANLGFADGSSGHISLRGTPCDHVHRARIPTDVDDSRPR